MVCADVVGAAEEGRGRENEHRQRVGKSETELEKKG